MNGIGIGEDVKGGFPVGMLVRRAEPRHAQRRRIGQGAAKIGGGRPCQDRRLERLQNRPRIIAKQGSGQLRMIRPTIGAAGRR